MKDASVRSPIQLGRRIGTAGIAALIGGVLVLGVGGRLAMRLSGAMAIVLNPEVEGRLTGDGFRIGRITVDDTLGLILFGGVFGSIIAGAYWVLLRERLPARRRLLVAFVAAAAIGGNQFVTPDNIDFVILHPVAMNVVLYPVVAGFAGVAIAWIDGRLARRGFAHGPVSAALVMAFGALGAGLALMLSIAAASDEPFMTAELFVLLAVTVPLWRAELSGKPAARMARVAAFTAVGVVLVEWVRLGVSIWRILGGG